MTTQGTELLGAELLGAELLGAVDRGEIVAHFQPQIDLATGDIVAVEALSRWEHPTRGTIPPDSFIPLAESIGMIASIGDHMLAISCLAAWRWRTDAVDLEISVNVSARQFSDPTFFSRVISAIDSIDLDRSRLTLEITESSAIADFGAVVRGLNLLRREGIGVSIDDFGTGHATLQLLDILPVTEVKFDKTLVQEPSPDATELLETGIRIVKARQLRSVAEGIETVEQLDRAKALGFDRAQGYYFSRPVAFERVPELASR